LADFPEKPDSPRRWPRGQRFTLTTQGREARLALRDAITAARSATGGREAQDTVVGAWASQHGVKPGDGTCLDELELRDRNVPEMAEALLECGLSRTEVQAAIDRLVTAGLVAAVPKPDSAGGTPPGINTPPYR
jgi:hypothetical protein